MNEKKLMHSTTLTREEMQKISKERVTEIAREFEEGFKLLEDYPRSVTFFGSTQTEAGAPDYETARTLANRIVKELDYAVVSGGGPGIMEAADRGAYEAGGNSVGLLIKLPNAQPTNPYIKKSVSFYYFFARKVCLAFGAEVFIFFPGGYGTLDEFFEIITLMQTRKIPPAPIICFGSEYWNKVHTLINETLLAKGMVAPEDLTLFKITDDIEEVLALIKAAPVRENVPFELPQ